MIEVIDIHGRSHFLSPQAVACVSDSDVSSRWYGIRSFVKLFDGKTIESSDDAKVIAEIVKADSAR